MTTRDTSAPFSLITGESRGPYPASSFFWAERGTTRTWLTAWPQPKDRRECLGAKAPTVGQEMSQHFGREGKVMEEEVTLRPKRQCPSVATLRHSLPIIAIGRDDVTKRHNTTGCEKPNLCCFPQSGDRGRCFVSTRRNVHIDAKS